MVHFFRRSISWPSPAAPWIWDAGPSLFLQHQVLGGRVRTWCWEDSGEDTCWWPGSGLPSDLTLPEVTSSGRPRAARLPPPGLRRASFPVPAAPLSPQPWAGCCLLVSALSAPPTPSSLYALLSGGCATSSAPETRAPGTREALSAHLVTEHSSKHKPAFLFRWLGTSVLQLKGKPLNVAFFFQGVSSAFTTRSGFLGHSFCVLTASAGASTGQEPESLCLYAGSATSVHRRGTGTLRTTLSSAAEARSMLAPFQLSLSTVSVADSVVGNALSS